MYSRFSVGVRFSRPVNFVEIEKVINQETAKFIEKAPKSTLVSMLQGICRRIRLEALYTGSPRRSAAVRSLRMVLLRLRRSDVHFLTSSRGIPAHA
jgi:hypothetical protein